MQSNRVSVEQGLSWLTYGWQLFMKAPGPWIGVTVIYFLINLMLPLVPIVGAVIMTLISPALYAGLLFIAADLGSDQAIDLGRMFHGLSDPELRNPLLTMGGILFAAQIILVVLFMVIGIAGTFSIYSLGSESAAALHAGVSAIIAVLVALTAAMIVTMAVIYAAPLVAFGRVPPVDALLSSLHACLINTVPMTVVGLVLMFLALLAIIPLFLGMLVLFPVTVCAIYASYRDIYPDLAPAQLTRQA